MTEITLDNCLKPTQYLDFDHESVKAFAHKYTHESQTDIEKASALFYAVRDGFFYNPYHLDLTHNGLKASNLVQRKQGYCVEKAVLLAATARCVGIPSRLFFGNVRNHIATGRLEEILQSNVLIFHGGAELFLSEKWVKLTPAFNKQLCHKLGVAPLEFDGSSDVLFQQYSNNGSQFMEYLEEYGSFEDLPFNLYISELKRHYGHIMDNEKVAEMGLFLKMEK
jgi:transglutaminase-like putative cysteine protease